MFKKIGVFLAVATTAVLTSVASAASPVSTAAASFTSQWGTDAAVVGGALIGAAFLAIGFKWVKGMIFS